MHAAFSLGEQIVYSVFSIVYLDIVGVSWARYPGLNMRASMLFMDPRPALPGAGVCSAEQASSRRRLSHHAFLAHDVPLALTDPPCSSGLSRLARPALFSFFRYPLLSLCARTFADARSPD